VLLLHDVLGAAASQRRTGSIIEIQALRRSRWPPAA
jgi:hypothetical protein